MGCDVVDLTRCGYIDQVIGLDLNLKARWQESVEAHYEIRVSLEELGYSANHSWSINTVKVRGGNWLAPNFNKMHLHIILAGLQHYEISIIVQ